MFEDLTTLTVMARHEVVTENLDIAAPVSLYTSGGKLFILKNPSQKLESRTRSCLKMANKETLKEKIHVNPVSLGNGCLTFAIILRLNPSALCKLLRII